MRLTLRFAVAMCLLLVLGGTACTDEPSDTTPDAPSPFRQVMLEGYPYAKSAAIEGTLDIDANIPCVRVITDHGSNLPLIFAHGTTFDADSGTVTLDYGAMFSDGERVRIAGGGGPPVFDSEYFSEVSLPDGCWTDGEKREVWVVAPIGISFERL